MVRLAMIKTGFYNDLTVFRFTAQGAYLSDGNDEVLLPTKYVTTGLKESEEISVFVYRDSLDRLVATTEEPFATADQFAYLKVIETTGIGAFLDWGLEKDLLVPHNQMLWSLKKDTRCVVRILVDTISDRIIATTRLRPFFDKDLSALSEGQKVSVMVHENKEFGSLVVIDNRYQGLILQNEFRKPPGVGTVYTAFIKNIHDDGKIDISLAPTGMEGRVEAQDIIMQKLVKAGGFLPFHDKSSPEEIKKNFKMSKKSFKKLIGNLQKKNLIVIKRKGIQLKRDGSKKI